MDGVFAYVRMRSPLDGDVL